MGTIKKWYSNFLRCVRLVDNAKAEISLPREIMEDILSRLPVKSILRFRSVSKPWLSLISNPSFTQLQLTQANAAHRTAFFIIADDVSAHKRYFLSAAHDGGSVTHLMAIDRPLCLGTGKEAEHLNGLVSFITTVGYFFCAEAFVFNPSTRKIFKLPYPTSGFENAQYFFGFDESRNEHKILKILHPTTQVKVMIFSMSNYSWRKINATGDIVLNGSYQITTRSVCVNSIIYLLALTNLGILECGIEILAFDLRTEKFSIVKVPRDVVLRNTGPYTRDGINFDPMYPYLIKLNGCIGVVCHHHVAETNEMHIWILQDYENHEWVRETVTFPMPWTALGCPFPSDSFNMDEIIFSLRKNKSSKNVISAYVYNMKSRCFRSVRFTLNHPFLCLETVKLYQIMCYVESILPL